MNHIVKPLLKIQYVAILRCSLSLNDCFTSICYLPGTLLGACCAPWNMTGLCPQEAVRVHEGARGQSKQDTQGERDGITLGPCSSG